MLLVKLLDFYNVFEHIYSLQKKIHVTDMPRALGLDFLVLFYRERMFEGPKRRFFVLVLGVLGAKDDQMGRKCSQTIEVSKSLEQNFF